MNLSSQGEGVRLTAIGRGGGPGIWSFPLFVWRGEGCLAAVSLICVFFVGGEF